MLTVGMLGLVAMQVAVAECGSYYCEDARILRLVTVANGDVSVKVSGTLSNLDCTLIDSQYITLPSSASRFKEIYANLLAFQLADRPIMVRIDTGSSPCTINYIYSDAP
jgi:hypothetical protein